MKAKAVSPTDLCCVLFVKLFVMSTVAMLLIGSGGCGGSPVSSFSPPPPPMTFPSREYAGQGQPWVADFNNDGKLDILTTSGPNVMMNLGKGDATFHAGVPILLPQNFEVCGVADFNGDGKPDLLLAPLSVLLGKGDGTFQPIPITTVAILSAYVAADLNGDGKADVIGVLDDMLFVYLSKGDGTFELAGSYKFGTNWGGAALALGDFNGDGRTDIVVTTGTDPAQTTGWPIPGEAIVLLGNGDGTFQVPIASPTYMSGTPMVADFNGDAKSDLGMTICDLTAGCIHWLQLGNGDGTFQSSMSFGNSQDPLDGALPWAAGDFNGDGNADLAVQDNPIYSGNVRIYLGNGDGTFSDPNIYPLGLYSNLVFNNKGVAVGDFNNDGKLDIAVANAVLLGNGDGTFQGVVREKP